MPLMIIYRPLVAVFAFVIAITISERSFADPKMDFVISPGPDFGLLQKSIGGEVTVLPQSMWWGGGVGYSHSFKNDTDTISALGETTVLVLLGLEFGYVREFRQSGGENGYRAGVFTPLLGLIVPDIRYMPIPIPYYRYTGFADMDENYSEFGLVIKILFGDYEPGHVDLLGVV
ncbi:MAG: hypothetical protein GY854_26605 [Deltaproteobacteria bacterium]|nr:hypothetical protein [Deltaproteobacteria bacterium]